MKDIFYNYDHNIDTQSSQMPFFPKHKKTESNAVATRLFNAKGDELGVKAKINSKFYLYFTFNGEVRDENGNFEAFIRDVLETSTLYFDVLGAKREVVASFVPELSDYADEIRVQVYTSEDGPLKYGVYRMHLYFETEEGIYTLFSEEDGILSIE